jgi:hypothetical protein
MGCFSGYYDSTTHLLYIIHGDPSQLYYIEWPKRSRDYFDGLESSKNDLRQWRQLFPTGSSPINPTHSFVIDI